MKKMKGRIAEEDFEECCEAVDDRPVQDWKAMYENEKRANEKLRESLEVADRKNAEVSGRCDELDDELEKVNDQLGELKEASVKYIVSLFKDEV